MTSLFCRHNRLTANCPICSKEMEAELRAKAPPRPPSVRRAKPAGSQAARARRAGGSRGGGMVTRKLARAADDGYRNLLVPGLRATADAERLAAALLAGAERREPPGPYEAVATEPDLDQATWLAFLLAITGGQELQDALLAASPRYEDGVPDGLPDGLARTVDAYLQWAERAGSQSAGITGEADWSPGRRFARVFERLALPGFTRAARFDLLAGLGAAALYELEADTLHVGPEDDATTTAAKRALLSGDRMLLERRARDLAQACELPLAALDRGLAWWDDAAEPLDPLDEPPPAMRRALGL
jgi:hypothetical protein